MTVQRVWYGRTNCMIWLYKGCDMVVQRVWYGCTKSMMWLYKGLIWLYKGCNMVVQSVWYDCTKCIWLYKGCDMVVQSVWYGCTKGVIWLYKGCDMVVQSVWYDCTKGMIKQRSWPNEADFRIFQFKGKATQKYKQFLSKSIWENCTFWCKLHINRILTFEEKLRFSSFKMAPMEAAILK